MGLDMFLSAAKNVSDTQQSKLLKSVGLSREDLCDDIPHVEVKVTVAYWRKANAIHSWFVENCQDGEDECQTSSVERCKLEELMEVCKAVVGDNKKAKTTLPTKDGFFFGGTEYDSSYFDEIAKTALTLEKILSNPSFEDCWFEYRASW